MASTDHGVMTSRPGSILAGRWRVVGDLGRGPLGELMRAEDLELARPVAVRFVPPELAGGDDLFARLELRCTRNLRLPRAEVPLLADLVDLLDVGRDELGRLFLVTDVFPGHNLADVLAREGPPPWQRLRALLVRACQIVHLSHEHGMIRQDLSTSALYPVRDKNDPGTLKVVSPGLMVAGGGRVWSCPEPRAAAMLARYAAPEQISTGVVDRRTDVYALGVILYECLTGRVPFADARPAHVLAAHLITPPAPFTAAVRRKIPAELEAIVLRALAKSPDDRWPTVMALANAMAAIEVGRCEFSGMLDTGGADDPAEHLEPQAPATSMRVDRARLSGRAGLVWAADPGSTGEHVLRDVLDADDSALGLASASSSASLSRPDGIEESVPGLAEESATRWVAPSSAPPQAIAPRRLAPWLLAGGLSIFTAGVVSVGLRPASDGAPSPTVVGAVDASPPVAHSPSDSRSNRPSPLVPASVRFDTLGPGDLPEAPPVDAVASSGPQGAALAGADPASGPTASAAAAGAPPLSPRVPAALPTVPPVPGVDAEVHDRPPSLKQRKPSPQPRKRPSARGQEPPAPAAPEPAGPAD
ncbi:serine/threonine-protein kinase [Nannocystis sp. SCPEA4]|uniref:serine/threonine protein kinase n=1 Tax=Nannocystis sp. SCPEA4 TaxID=2996787 RepID=UPI00226EC8D5|nr:serine/threonine-protein kinase [Nannocystis sp. SCPEA4]MCY1058345.1 protein kinase [Nannocystis sp. SCPEA4]